MIPKFIPILALAALLACPSVEAPFGLESPGTILFSGGALQPMVSNLQFDPVESEARQAITTDERIHGTRDAPAGGFGLMHSWDF